MNLQFTIAMHALAFLSKHSTESFSSPQLAELICVNPVQLRNVMRKLSHNNFIQSHGGKSGGYQAIEKGDKIVLSDIFTIFRSNTFDERVLTGSTQSTCEIARNMSRVTTDLMDEEYELLKNYYSTLTIHDLLHTIEIKENSHE